MSAASSDHQTPDVDEDLPPTNDVASSRPYDEPDISTDEFWNQDLSEQDAVFARLRRERPVSWQRPIESALSPEPNDVGFWAVARHDDITEVSHRNDVFVSRYGVHFDHVPREHQELGQSFLAMDEPRHTRLRRLVVAAFTPRQIKRIEGDIAARAHRIVAAAAQRGRDGEPIDFVTDIAKHLPIEMFGDMFGVPAEVRPEVVHAADELVAWADPDLLAGRDAGEVAVAATLKIHQIGIELAARRRQKPENDLLTSLVQAEIDGERLTDAEIGSIAVLFSVAATDTTRHTASFAVRALTDFPDQRRWLWDDFDGRIGSAVEEFLRWGTVVLTFRRTAVAEYELGGQHILPGDKVVMLYGSGNRDAEVFDAPEAFDLSRNPNKHIAFGGGGVHYCLGTHLARSMLRSLFAELHGQLPDFVIGEPKLMKTNFMRGVLSLPFAVTGFTS
ncbi:MAG TPA: cytochrome P450 [Mycobacterium sp.]